MYTLTGAVQQAAGGQLLDDATVLVLDWYGRPDQDRGATAGATRGRASQPRPARQNALEQGGAAGLSLPSFQTTWTAG